MEPLVKTKNKIPEIWKAPAREDDIIPVLSGKRTATGRIQSCTPKPRPIANRDVPKGIALLGLLNATPSKPNAAMTKQTHAIALVPNRSQARPVKKRPPCVLQAPTVKTAPSVFSLKSEPSACNCCLSAGQPYTSPAAREVHKKENANRIHC